MSDNFFSKIFKRNDKPNEKGDGQPRAGTEAGGAKRNAGNNARGGKITPVSPSRARLERRANDEKIIKTIKIIFTTIVTIAIIGIIVSIFLYAYKPTVATVAGQGISQYEFVYNLKLASANASTYSTTDSIAQQALSAATEMKMMEVIAKERGITISAEDREQINSQMEYIDQMAAYDTTGGGGTGDDYLIANIGINKNQYKKIMESEIYGTNLHTMEYDQLEIPEEDALNAYNANIASYEEVTVRHILFLYEGKVNEEDPDTSEATRTREESEALAHATEERIKAGEDMAGLVQALSEDTDLTNEGIYTFKRADGYEQAFKDWSFEDGRQIGDVGVCETSYGYHVMKLESRRTVPFEEAKDAITDDIKTEQVESIITSWKSESRFQAKTNQRVYDSVVKETLG